MATRYALVTIDGTVLEVLGYSLGKSRSQVERLFGIRDRPDLAAIAARHLPAVV